MNSQGSELPKIVAIFEKLRSDVFDRLSREGRINLVYSPPNLSFADLNTWFLEQLDGASAAVVWPVAGKFGEQQIKAAAASGHSKLKVVSTCSVGTEAIDLDACRAAGIKVGYTPCIGDDSIAEYTIAMLLLHSRRLAQLQDIILKDRFMDAMYDVVRDPTLHCGFSPAGKTIGFYGFGRIAQKTAEKLLPFGVARILYTTSKPNPFSAESFPRLAGLTQAFYPGTTIANEPSLPELAAQADILIVLCPGNASTHASVNKSVFDRMKPTAVLLNVARGNIVVNTDLVAALKSNQIAAALLDVIEGEPHIHPDHPLLVPELKERVLLLPHAASTVFETRKLMCDLTARNILSTLGFPDTDLGNKQALLPLQAWTHFA